MIFATDLDRTMIYSNKFVNKDNINKISVVETLDGKEISYMSNYAIKELEKLNKKIYVVPVTTRSVKQFTRINTFKYCEYAITTNGGTILHNGTVLETWENQILKIVKEYKEKMNDVMNVLKNQIFITREPSLIDEKFIFSKTDNIELCEKFLSENIDLGIWNYTIQSQKVYVIPKEITKSNALDYLRNLLNTKTVIAAGDGKMDRDMLEYADYAILPKHGELYKKEKFKKEKISLVDNGILSSNDIIKEVKKYIK